MHVLTMIRMALIVFLAAGLVPATQAQVQICETQIVGRGTSTEGSVSIDGDLVVVGAFTESAHVYRRIGANWEQIAMLPGSAKAVGVSGDIVVVSDHKADVGGVDNVGRVWVYRVSGSTITLEQTLSPAPLEADTQFGRVVAVKGNRIVGGSSAGKALVFEHDGAIWQQTHVLQPPTASSAYARWGVALTDDAVVVLDHSGGSRLAFVHRFDGSTWVEEAVLDTQVGSVGGSVAMTDDLIAIAATVTPEVVIYRRNGSAWVLEDQLMAWQDDDLMGWSLAMHDSGSREIVVAGAPWADLAGEQSGAAYAFVNDGAGWGPLQQLVPTDAAPNVFYGSGVATDGQRILVSGSFMTSHTYEFEIHDGVSPGCDCVPYCPGEVCGVNEGCTCGECACLPGWTGENCMEATCSFSCNNGTCVDGACECDPGWQGEFCDCEFAPCLNDCSGNGVCDLCGACECDSGWGGPDCSEACPELCHGQGTCVNGICECDIGWGEENCSTQLFDRARLFMSALDEAADVPPVGDTTVTIDRGSIRRVGLWQDFPRPGGSLNSYQAIVRWHATPLAGAAGSVMYLDDGNPGGGSGSVNLLREDYVLFGMSSPFFFNETESQNGFGPLASIPSFHTEVPVSGRQYLGEFDLIASDDAAGMHRLEFVPNGQAPAGGISFICLGLGCPYVDRTEALIIIVYDCGDGVLEQGEQCDDGNDANGDGCTSACRIELCGDHLVNNSGLEQCDDGNLESGDGCSETCTVEFCGDGLINNSGTEECDDGNASNDDACVAGCRLAVCGDGFVHVGAEACDDGDLFDSDGCSATCYIEDGWACDGAPSQCVAALPAVSRWGTVLLVILVGSGVILLVWHQGKPAGSEHRA
jgi:cysteine-rich repeat protein